MEKHLQSRESELSRRRKISDALTGTERSFMPNWKPTLGKGRHKQSYNKWFKWSQIIGPLLPIPVGCYLLYKAIKSFNRNPPPIATDAKTVMSRPLYGEPIYQRVSFSASTFARNMRPRGEG